MAHANDDLALLDAVEQAALIRTGDLSPLEAVEAAIARIEAMNPAVNAVITERFDKALEEAAGELPDGPFRGVPFLMKDLWPTSQGDPFHMGSQALKEANNVADQDAAITRRYREAGFVILGRTNTPELGLVATTEPVAYGPSRNPWNTGFGTGGSSGGAAAAVASGMVPAANASDGGGSIRIPAAMCGLVGLKPSRGRVPMGPYQDEWGLSVQHVVCHTMRDAASILDATALPTLGDGVIAPTIGQPYSDQVGARTDRLRIGVWTKSPRENLVLDAECAQSVRDAARLLSDLGHDVVEAHPAIAEDPDTALNFSAVWVSNTAAGVERIGQMIGREMTADDVEPATWAMAEMGRALNGPQVVNAQAAMHTFRRTMAEWWEQGWDLLLTPTTMQPPPKIGELTSTPDEPLRASLRSIPYGAYTSMFNVTGQPALSLPLHRTAEGLPIGVQLVAAYGREDVLFRVGSQLEREVQWSSDRAPTYS